MNFIQVGVVGSTVKNQAWGLLVNKAVPLQETGYGERISVSDFKALLSEVIYNEANEALEAVHNRPKPPEMSAAEHTAETEALLERVIGVMNNFIKNYAPVLVRTFKDGLPFLDSSGNPIPKTAMEQAYKLKAEAEKSAAPVLPLDVAKQRIAAWINYCSQNGLDSDAIYTSVKSST